jgi:iron(III) transport system permease protein
MRRASPQAPVAAWVALGAVAFLCFPWFALADGIGWATFGHLLGDAESANGWAQWLLHGRTSVVFGLAGLIACAVSLALRPGRSQGAVLALGGALGCIGLLASGFVLGKAQPGFGWGGSLAIASLAMLMAFGLARRGFFGGDLFVAAAVVACASLLALFIVFPVAKALASAFVDDAGALSAAAMWERIANERNFGLACIGGGVRCGVAWNTLALGIATATSTVLLGTLMALMAERSARRFARPLNMVAMLPIITPPFVVGLGLILLFGRAGIVNQLLEWAFGITPSRWFYGWLGVWVAQTFAFTPIAFMIMRGVVQGVAPSLEEAAQTLRADAQRTFTTVTLPLLKPGLANAFLVGFIESMADFGNPIVVGGQFSVLSTEIFFAIVGAQYDQGRAASLAWLLTAFALGAFALQRLVLGTRNYTTVGGKGEGGLPTPLPRRVRALANGVAVPWIAFTLVLYLFALAGGFVQTWGRDYTPTLAHFRTAFAVEAGEFGVVWAGTAWNSFFTTIKLAGISAPLTAALGLLIAYLVARTRFRGVALFEFSALLAFAIPGTVLGVSYILAFNVPPFELTGTGAIIVLCFLFRNLPVGVRAGTAAFKQLDRSLDEASLMLRASSTQTLRYVVLPLLKPALVAALVYSFVRAITTVSAVIFLVTAENELATTYIIGRVGNGDYGVALAYCTVLILLMSAVTALIQWLVGERRLGRREVPVLAPARGVA